jgi:hypothetical protein
MKVGPRPGWGVAVSEGMGCPSAGIESRTLRVRLREMLCPYGAQESDCISPLRDIPAEGHPIPSPANVGGEVRLTFLPHDGTKGNHALEEFVGSSGVTA